MKQDVIILEPLLPKQMEILEKTYTLHRYDLAADKNALLAAAAPICTGAVASGHFPLHRDFIARLPAVKIVACSSVGYETIDVNALTERAVKFTNTPDVLTDDVADTAVMLMLAARRRLIIGDRYVRSGDWGREGMMELTRRTAGSRVGIAGFGRIGQAIARRCAAMEQEIAYFGRSQKPGIENRYFGDLVSLASWADVLIAVTPGGAATRGLISKEVLEALGPEGTFINVSRGTVVDEPALIAALRSGKLGSAGLDVFLNEPDPDPAFGKMENAVLYPHHASGTVETRDAMMQLVVDNLAAFYAGKPLLTPVN
ncbi:MAG: 2-hydroxyacid dehydrogenase [Rhizobiales bacterium]|nr:2-hydroxyacid dehydrogenase [Hyphomicrobiales bacterium]